MLLSLLNAGLLASPILNAPKVPPIVNATDPPTSRWVSFSVDNDHVGCKKKPEEGESVIYYPADPELCVGVPGDDGDPMWVKTYLSETGIRIGIYHDASCANEVYRTPELPYGGCFHEDGDEYGATVDLVQYLPTPQAGRFLEKRCYVEGDIHNPPQCGCPAPIYILQSTTCAREIDFFPESTGESGKRDMEVDCGDGLDKYSTFQFKTYASKDATCTGAPTNTSKLVNTGGCITPPPTIPGDSRPFVSEAIWCGAGCATWKYFRASHQFCDAPESGGAHAIDLSKEFGPRCRSADGIGAPGGCCYAPLGYDGGPSVGTSCAQVCGGIGRYGAANEYCVGSEDSHAGNCFCGPSKQVHPPRHG